MSSVFSGGKNIYSELKYNFDVLILYFLHVLHYISEENMHYILFIFILLTALHLSESFIYILTLRSLHTAHFLHAINSPMMYLLKASHPAEIYRGVNAELRVLPLM